MVIGMVGQAFAHRSLTRGRGETWITMGALHALLIPLILLTGEVTLDAEPGAILTGLGVALGLYVASRVFVSVMGGWGSFDRDLKFVYRQRDALPLGVELAIGGLAGFGEELFWRGLTIEVLAPSLGRPQAAALSLLLFIGVDAISRSRAVVVGAAVGGIVWTGLVLWPGGGLIAAIVCHATWTVLMIAFPPGESVSEPGSGD